MSRHIVFCESGYPHPHGGGGAGTYVQLVGRELVRRGHKVSVVAGMCAQCGPESVDQGVIIYRPKLRGSWHWYMSKLPGLNVGALALRTLEHGWHLYRFLEQLHAHDPIDVVEFTEGGDFWHAWRAPFPYLIHLHGSRYTFRHQAGWNVGLPDRLHRRLELHFIRRANHVVAPCQAILETVQEENGGPFANASVIPYPLDGRLQRTNHVAPQRKEGPAIVLFAARNDPVKGGSVLLAAVPQVRRIYPDVEFHFYGFQPRATETLPAGVSIHPFIPKKELLNAYQQADICVVPSLWDNSPNTVYEAMAAGKAVVASRVGGIPELVVDGETGLLVPPGDVGALGNAIVQLLSADKTRTDMGRKGYERIVRLADPQQNVTRRLALYRSVINTSGNRGTRSSIR